ncbi:tyrosine-type recombinase/integrase [Rheinheimera baltica]|uniref:Tyrosine-type recombinase/integrase n=1 Tax=Rheinheimera baltica TaxID=67576 RepID=A0ABT9I5R1_9GAMM|nr:tyrosine-type recombinase/integrase [Rheinheimera baltica]MDP5138742.1 tyrosine-type recombinase/integrase [Rheinheimera baltica]
MIKITRCNETDCLVLSFQYLGSAVKLRTPYLENTANRKIVRAIARRIAAELISGTFKMDDYLNADAKAKVLQTLPLHQRSLPTFASYASSWLSARDADFAPASRRNVRRVIERYLVPALGGLEINKISEHELLQLRLSLRQQLPDDSINLSAARLNQVFRIAGQILSDAAANYSYLPLLRPLLLTGRKQDIDPFTPQETEELLRHVPVILLELFQVMLFSGMRLAEICALQWADVDFELGHIRVRHSMVNDKIQLLRKSARVRDVVLTEQLRLVLGRQYLKTSHLQWVFATDSNRAISAKTIAGRVWHRALSQSGVRSRTIHQCLWTAAVELFADGANISQVARAC